MSKSIRDVGNVTETGTAEEEFSPNYRTPIKTQALAKGGKTQGYAKGGVTRADGCIRKGHTKGKMR